jgi:hypothetical protein
MAWRSPFLPMRDDADLSRLCKLLASLFFVRKQKPFRIQPASESSQVAIRSDYAVTGSHDRDRISTISGAYGSGGSWIANCACYLGVRPRLTEGYCQERRPNLLLKVRADEIKVEVESGPSAGKILVELALRPLENGVVWAFDEIPERNALRVVIFPQNRAQSSVAANELQHPDWRLYRFIEVRHFHLHLL